MIRLKGGSVNSSLAHSWIICGAVIGVLHRALFVQGGNCIGT